MNIKKMIQTSMLIAIGYIGNSLFIIPLGFVRIAPMQHLMNIVTSALLGPWYSLAQAFGVSFLRNVTGTGSPLAFPGSMIGAFLSGLLFRHYKKFWLLGAGEVVGTGIFGALISYPIARLVLSQEATLFGFLPAFFQSSLAGTIIGLVIVIQAKNKNLFKLLGEEKNDHTLSAK
ncbi:energy coupling factor transporter S component ThiW [Alkalibacterium kapii]|uniref:Energy coupling factor transporter S component ThiW n=1 Tax=Alkalibacterium kapii TaxID=426704 RepID=A0A511ASL0_9LACT|nr:energy coupling factor transporter S component ThiW [Alkalibacterium kapii]GEK91189.1 energy coupling factor transporter S component ThiW [Alkalibacterium kapii]